MQVNQTTTQTYSSESTTNKSTTTSTETSNTLGKDDFLKLLVTQLQNQDPMEPMKDMDFIGQMASFSALEQMTNLNTNFQTLSDNISYSFIPVIIQQSGNLIGKTVTYTDPDTSETMSGIIDSVKIKQGIPYYVIGNKEISMGNISQIEDTGNQEVLNQILDQITSLNGTLNLETGDSGDQ